MSLPASQRRALNQIEKTLADDHPSLGPLFAIFSGLNSREVMPVTEQVTVPRWRWRLSPALRTLIGLALAIGTLVTISLILPRPQPCAVVTATPAAAQAHSVPGGRQPACPSWQGKPGGTSQGGLFAP